MQRSWIVLTLLAAIGATLVGCGTRCENARSRFEDRYSECDIPYTEAEPPEGEEVCTDADGAYLECISNCADSATCEALKGEDPAGAVDFGKCYGDCSN
ncbi:MAG: hypothetical protein R3F14_41670 [Polyangiaceae bacterium]